MTSDDLLKNQLEISAGSMLSISTVNLTKRSEVKTQNKTKNNDLGIYYVMDFSRIFLLQTNITLHCLN